MNTLIPGAPLRSLSPTTNEYQRAQGESRAAKPARAARFTLDAPEHSGTIPGARGDILTPGVALTSNLAVIFTLNQHTGALSTNRSQCKAPRTSSRSVSSRARCGRGRRFGLGVTGWRLRYNVERATPRASQASAVCPIRPASSSAATISRSRRSRVDSGGSPVVRRFFFGSPTSSPPEPGDVGVGRSRARAP